MIAGLLKTGISTVSNFFGGSKQPGILSGIMDMISGWLDSEGEDFFKGMLTEAAAGMKPFMRKAFGLDALAPETPATSQTAGNQPALGSGNQQGIQAGADQAPTGSDRKAGFNENAAGRRGNQLLANALSDIGQCYVDGKWERGTMLNDFKGCAGTIFTGPQLLPQPTPTPTPAAGPQ